MADLRQENEWELLVNLATTGFLGPVAKTGVEMDRGEVRGWYRCRPSRRAAKQSRLIADVMAIFC